MNSIPLMSRDIVDEFIRSGHTYQTIDIERAGRSKISVYNAMLGYLKRNDNLRISVRMVHGDIVLVNDKLHQVDVEHKHEEHREDQAIY